MTKLIGLDAETMELRWPQGAPYRLRLRVKDAEGDYLALAGSVLALSFYAGATSIVSAGGAIDADETSEFALFELSDEDRELAGTRVNGTWQIGGVYTNGTLPILRGPAYFTDAAPSNEGAPTGAAGEVDDALFDLATETLVVEVANWSAAFAQIDDAATGETTTWSSTKMAAELALKDDLGLYKPLLRQGDMFDLADYDPDFNWVEGGCTDGNYVYFVDHPSKKVARISIVDPTDVTILDLSGVGKGTATVSIASPGVVTNAGHGLSADDPVQFRSTGLLPTGLAVDTLYYVRNPGADTFELAATPGGASINTTGSQSGVHQLFSEPLEGFAYPIGAFFDGRYLYVGGHSGGVLPYGSTIVARIDTLNFTLSSVALLQIGVNLPVGFNSTGQGVGAFDGRYAYSMVLGNATTPTPGIDVWLVQFDTLNYAEAGVRQVKFPSAGASPLRRVLVAYATDGQIVYTYTRIWDGVALNPAANIVTRFDAATMTVIDETQFGTSILGHTNGLIFDGRSLWISPNVGTPMYRIDTLNWPAAESFDLAATDATLDGFSNISAIAHNGYGYFPPNRNGKLLRVNTQNSTFEVCDLALTDPSAATLNYAIMVLAGGALWIAGGDPTVVGSGVIRLKIDAGEMVPGWTGLLSLARGGTGGGNARDAALGLSNDYVLAKSAVPVSHTGAATEFTLGTVTIPAGAIGPNGHVEIIALFSYTGVNTKTARIRFGGTSIYEAVPTTQLASQAFAAIANQNAANSQVSFPVASNSFSTNSGAVLTPAIDTTAPVDITFTGQLTNTSESISLRRYLVRVIPGL